MEETRIHLSSLKDLPALAEKIVSAFPHCRVWAFYGEMGAGKTTLISEIGKQLGSFDTVNSPTFALVNEYRTPASGPVYHFDFYRIKDIREAFDLGYEEYFYSGNICLVEWPEKVGDLMPDQFGSVRLTRNADDSRTVLIQIP